MIEFVGDVLNKKLRKEYFVKQQIILLEALRYYTLFNVQVEINLNLSLNSKYQHLNMKIKNSYKVFDTQNFEVLNKMLEKSLPPTERRIYLVSPIEQQINPLVPNAPFLCSLKTSENLKVF